MRELALDNEGEEIDQRVGERFSLPACQGTNSSSWSQVTCRAETLHARPPCLFGAYPWCLSYPSTAKILVYGVYTECLCHANWICQMDGWGIVEGGVSLRYAKKELISPSLSV